MGVGEGEGVGVGVGEGAAVTDHQMSPQKVFFICSCSSFIIVLS